MSETALVIVKFLIGKSVGQFMLTVALFFLIIGDAANLLI